MIYRYIEQGVLEVFKKMSLKFKMLSAFLSASFVLIIVGALGFYSLRDLAAKYSHISTANLANAMELGKMHSKALDAQRSLLQAELTINPQVFAWNINNFVFSLDDYAEADKAKL